MRTTRAVLLAFVALALVPAAAGATSVLSMTREGGEPYFEGRITAVSTNAAIAGYRCERVQEAGEVVAGSSTRNSTVNPFINAIFTNCREWNVEGSNIGIWIATFNSTAMTATISNFEIRGIGVLTCYYGGTVQASYTNPLPPARAKITINAGQTLSYVRGNIFCPGTVSASGTYDIATEESRDLYLVTR